MKVIVTLDQQDITAMVSAFVLSRSDLKLTKYTVRKIDNQRGEDKWEIACECSAVKAEETPQHSAYVTPSYRPPDTPVAGPSGVVFGTSDPRTAPRELE